MTRSVANDGKDDASLVKSTRSILLGLPGAVQGWRSDHLGGQSDRLVRLITGKFRSSRILSLNPLFREKHDSNTGETTPCLYNGGLMADWGYPNRIYKFFINKQHSIN
jgi:hypothetical protein